MIATFNSETGVLNIKGRQNRATPRHWLVTLLISNDYVNEKLVFEPKDKIRLRDLHDLVMSEVAKFEAEYGEAIKVNFTAIAR